MSFKEELTTLVFDWGDTLMVNYPQYDGPMVNWPVVAAVDGTIAALRQLKQKYTLLVATNAAASNAGQVEAALERAGLGHLFEYVYTYQELHSRKPDPAFFHALQDKTGQMPGSLAMIGDDYSVDVIGAWQSGWHTIWYNPGKQAAPALNPLHHAELHNFHQLPDLLARAGRPGVNECAAWTVQAGTNAALAGHVQAVAAVAYQLAVWLRGAGVEVDVLLAHRGGLLHDLAKLAPLTSEGQRDHGERGAQLLEQRGQLELAEIARRHPLHRIDDPQRRPLTWEQKLVYLADKLVEGSTVVSFERRLDSLRARYPQHAAGFDALVPSIHRLIEETCQAAGFPAAELTERLQGAFFPKP